MTHWGAATAAPELAGSGLEPLVLQVNVEGLASPGHDAGERGRTLAEGITALYQKCQFYDVFLVLGSQRFPAHKVALAAISPKLCEQLAEMQSGASAPAAVAQDGSQESQPAQSPSRHPELQLEGISHAEAVRALLDFVYGLGGGAYDVSSDEVNSDVLRLAKNFGLSRLQDCAAAHLLGGLTTDNAILRLATCEEFGLVQHGEKIADALIDCPEALARVAGSADVQRFPALLQGLLLRAANRYKPGAAKPEARGAKRAKLSQEAAVTGGA